MEFNVPTDQKKIRMDQYLTEVLADISRSKIQVSIRNGDITLDGKSVKPGTILTGGEAISGDISKPSDVNLVKQEMALDLLYEDDAIVVINKPAGLVVHPGSGNIDGTLVNGLLYHFCNLSGINPGRPGIVHRLDKDTSGVIIVAKTDQAHANISEQFELRKVTKKYLAIVWGKSPEEGQIEGNIKRHNTNRIKFEMTENKGRFSKTKFRTEYYSPPFSYVTMKPETGRTHQLRVHFSHAGNPIVGDELYGGGSKRIKSYHTKYTAMCKRVLKELARTALHAKSLTLRHPESSEFMTWTAPLPEDMENALSILKENNE